MAIHDLQMKTRRNRKSNKPQPLLRRPPEHQKNLLLMRLQMSRPSRNSVPCRNLAPARTGLRAVLQVRALLAQSYSLRRPGVASPAQSPPRPSPIGPCRIPMIQPRRSKSRSAANRWRHFRPAGRMRPSSAAPAWCAAPSRRRRSSPLVMRNLRSRKRRRRHWLEWRRALTAPLWRLASPLNGLLWSPQEERLRSLPRCLRQGTLLLVTSRTNHPSFAPICLVPRHRRLLPPPHSQRHQMRRHPRQLRHPHRDYPVSQIIIKSNDDLLLIRTYRRNTNETWITHKGFRLS